MYPAVPALQLLLKYLNFLSGEWRLYLWVFNTVSGRHKGGSLNACLHL